MAVERVDPSTVAIAGGNRADLQRAIESDYRIRSGMCPNGCGLMTISADPMLLGWQECPKCNFSTNNQPDGGPTQ